MTITAWRIFRKRHAKTAFSGEGARLYGGRWTSPGRAVVYLAQSQPLAALEMLVHLEIADAMKHYQVCEVRFSDSIMESIDAADLPANWRRDPAPARLRAIGDEWIDSNRTAILRVPSAIVPTENNYLLNPAHPDFPGVKMGTPLWFRFDRPLAD